MDMNKTGHKFMSNILFIIPFVISIFECKIIKILHLTDLHLDPHFQERSSIYSSCHRNATISTEEIAEIDWGRECDSSQKFISQALKQISDQHNSTISCIFLTGDNSRYNF